jgi:hypothetical protein
VILKTDEENDMTEMEFNPVTGRNSTTDRHTVELL